MIQWYKKVVFENYANFSGRARRSEYWYFALMQFLIILVILGAGIATAGLDEGLTGLGVFWMLYVIYVLATFIPGLAVAVRRLHDSGKSGWYYFVALIPFIGGLWLLFLLFTEGTNGPNDYGPDPKNEFEEMNEIGTTQEY